MIPYWLRMLPGVLFGHVPLRRKAWPERATQEWTRDGSE